MGWIGVDLDGTLAKYDRWRGIEHIGEPIPAMVERVKAWIANGERVKIFTARVSNSRDQEERMLAERVIREWTKEHVGIPLEVTCCKDFAMIVLWDDRCVAVEHNTGRALGGHV
jgi:hypothetical protein